VAVNGPRASHPLELNKADFSLTCSRCPAVQGLACVSNNITKAQTNRPSRRIV
jgi:hypothetical protein